MTGETFVVAVDGSVIGRGGGMAGLVLEIPDSFEFSGASYVTRTARRGLRLNSDIARLYKADSGYTVYAVSDSIAVTRETDADLRVLLRFKAAEAGNYTFKCISGIAEVRDGKLRWRSTDPADVRDFTEVTDADRVRGIRVVHPERIGTAAIALDGNRQYLVLPDADLPAFSLDRDFSVETWCRTTSTDVPLISTRPDDFTGRCPLELQVSARGDAELLCADGRTLYRSGPSRFIADGMWHHLAVSFCRDSMRYTMFVDGAAVDTLYVPETLSDVRTTRMHVGTNLSLTRFARAQFDEMRIWETCRNVQEIAYYKDLALSGYETALAVLFSFDSGSDGRIPGQSQGDSLSLTAYNSPRLVVSTTPLQIELLAFSARLADDTVRMTWETYDESKVAGYEVERRTESGRFLVHERVEPLRTLERHQNYLVTDIWRGRSVHYYRLRKINTDGTVLFSEEVPIGLEAVLNFSLEDNVPNPFTEATEIRYTLTRRTRVELNVYDLMGKLVEALVSEKQDKGEYGVTFEARDLPGGMYFYKMRTSAGSQTKKMYLAR